MSADAELRAEDGREYTPTTAQVRNNMAFAASCATVALGRLGEPDPALADAMRNTEWPSPGVREAHKAAFDRWLDAHEQAVRKAGCDQEAVRAAVAGVLFNATNYPEPAQARMLGQDIAPLTEKVTTAVLAAIAQSHRSAEP